MRCISPRARRFETMRRPPSCGSEGDFDLVDHESVRCRRRLEARSRADHAVDVGDGPAHTTDDVMVIVRHPRFEERNASGRLDSPGEAGTAQHRQRVWVALSGAPSPDANMALVDSSDPAVLATVLRQIQDSGSPCCSCWPAPAAAASSAPDGSTSGRCPSWLLPWPGPTRAPTDAFGRPASTTSTSSVSLSPAPSA
jgi:hypothetical protein